uniref:FliM/FliN family flagellar motor switch protein n=1 Tax=Anaeromyxobacter terrae TaxID=2925406 RepID=UPI001F59CFF9
MSFPFELPSVSRGHAELTFAARALGAEVASAAARSLGSLLGGAVAVEARAVPARARPRAGVARLGLDLPALPGAGALEVEPGLVVALVDRLAGGTGETFGATTLTGVEAAALELFALSALDGACEVAAVEEALAPRLCRAAPEPAAALAIELTITASGVSGRARLLLPPSAVRALGGAPDWDGSAAGLRVVASLRGGAAALAPEELDALARGDVVVLDATAEPRALVLPGGARLAGHLEDGTFHVEEIDMTQRMAQLPVVLEIELARVEVTLAELARLEPGATLPLALDRRGLVTLRAGE